MNIHVGTGHFGAAGIGVDLQRVAGDGDEHDVEHYPGVVERDDSEKAARVEGLEIIWRAAGVQQNSADQKTGENEEEIDAAPAERDAALEKLRDSRGVGGRGDDVMDANDGEDGDAAQAVEFRDAGGLQRG